MTITISGTTGLTANGSVFTDSSSNVGIGTSSPASRIHASYAGAVNTNTFNVSTISDTTTPRTLIGANLVLSNDGTTYTKPATSISGAGILFESINNLNAQGSIQFLSAPDTNSSSATPVERMRIDSSGNLLVGKTATSVGTAGFEANASGMSATNSGAEAANFNRNTSDGTIVIFRRSSSGVGTISVTTTNTAYNTSSDYRLKHDIAPMTDALALVAALKPCTYKWNADGSDGQGFIAHELAEVVPQCVTGEKDAVDADGNPIHQGIDTSFLVATLTAAIQEQQALITALTARIEALEAK